MNTYKDLSIIKLARALRDITGGIPRPDIYLFMPDIEKNDAYYAPHDERNSYGSNKNISGFQTENGEQTGHMQNNDLLGGMRMHQNYSAANDTRGALYSQDEIRRLARELNRYISARADI